jgi:TolA-binding protein
MYTTSILAALLLAGTATASASQAWFSQTSPAFDVTPPPATQSGPADSLYRLAREALNRNDYSRAAETFENLRRRFPRSDYAGDSYYWEA